MRRLLNLAYRSLPPGVTRAPTEGAIAVLGDRNRLAADGLRLALADSFFSRGDYRRARAYFAQVGDTIHAVKARQMLAWIDFKYGLVGNGWPEYPGAVFDAAEIASGRGATDGDILVRDANQPVELVSQLGLPPWHPGMSRDLPVLVWFNFKYSLGGELLCAKLLKCFEQKLALPMVLAGDARLLDVLRANFPDMEVVDKESNLRPLAGKCGAFLLARDILSYIVREESDFAAIAATQLVVPDPSTTSMPPRQGRARVALSWKTTNKTQGRYRNIPTAQIAKFLSRFDVEFHSVQHGVSDEERQIFQQKLGERIQFDTVNTGASVGALAADLNQMDAVVTIDNSVLHIAGAFGIPAFAMLSVPSYWAWPTDGTSSRWYDSVTLIHQRRPKHWQDVLEALDPVIQQHARGRPPSSGPG
jgi:hypothetical protein